MDDRLIVVTGGAGFIGSCVIKHLNDLNFSNLVIVDDLKKTEKWKNLVSKRFKDLLPKEMLFSWLKGRESEIQAFIHLGACSDTMEMDGDYLLENNYRYTLRLAEYALHNQIRFIYASSAATYGNGEEGFSDDPALLPLLKPLNMYGYSKHLFDLWALNEGVLDRLVGLKYFNIFGPNEWHKGRMASAITRMVPEIANGHPIRLFKSSDPQNVKDGEQKRDFLYVKDAVKMTCAFLNHEKANGIFNIGRGEASSWNALASAVFAAMNRPVQIEYVDMPLELVSKYQNYSCADLKKTGRFLDCLAKTSLKEDVEDYVRNYLLPGQRW